MIISARLWPAIQVGDATLSVNPTDRVGHDGKPVWDYAIDTPEWEYEDSDLRGWGNAREMMAAFLAFLGAAAESYRYEMGGRESDNSGLFPAHVREWAYQNEDELELAMLELEEGGDGEDD